MFENKAEKNHDNPTIKVVTDQEIEIGGSKSKQSRPPTLPPSSADSQEDTVAVVFSSQRSQFADYTTWKGIENKTGIEREHAYYFVLKELLDNAVDYLETQHNGAAAAAAADIPPLEIHVTIKKIEPQEKLIRIVVSNSNYDTSISSSGSKATFSKQMLNSIFDFDRYHSSKRNQFKITKGALGDALKEVLCIPHVLAHDNEINNWDYPLKIYAAQKVFQVHLAIDRINQLIHARIDDDAEVTYYDDTKIEVTLPVVDGQNKDDLITRLLNYLCNYAIFATHIGFSFEDESNQEEIFLEFPQLQTINPKWKNHSSIHYYERKQFHDFILGLENNDSIIYSVLYKTFREASNMRKTELTQITVGQLKHSPSYIDRLYDELRKSMSAPTSLALPFDITKKDARAQALKQRVKQRYGHFSEMKYRSATGTFVQSGSDQSQFPFFFEIAIFHDVQFLRSNLAFTQALNCSAIPNTSWIVFGGDEFEWQTAGSKYVYTSNTIQDIFRHYGYSHDNKKCKKPRSLIIANLISPKIDYQSYGKSRIDFRPFADVVAKTTVLACMGGGRASDGKPSKKAVLFEVLEKRKHKWQAMDAVSRLKHWWTQSDVFYATRKLLIECHYANEEIDRDYITGLIKEICEDELYVKREDIGILAADRAQLYFKGRWMDVGLKEIEELSLYGVDMLIIEKEGIAEQLALFADEKGIALLNTRGFLTEYAEVLSKKSEKEGCNIAILTDFDVSGLILATKVPGAYRIGIDFETLDDLGLDIEDVEEVYKPGNHLKPLQEGGELADVYPQDWVDYIEDKRVEINSVVTELDDNAKFWEWIVQKLREQFDTRNYNRAVYIPEYVIPKCLESLNEKVKDKGIAILRERRKKLQERLSDIGPGFLFDRTDEALVKKGDNDDIITISKYEQTLADQSRHIIESHEIIKPILDKIEDLDNELSITRNYCDDP
jgi:hypothetical protein